MMVLTAFSVTSRACIGEDTKNLVKGSVKLNIKVLKAKAHSYRGWAFVINMQKLATIFPF